MCSGSPASTPAQSVPDGELTEQLTEQNVWVQGEDRVNGMG